MLYLDGSLVYYHDETQRDMDGRIHIKYSCRDVRTGRECRGEQRPTSPVLCPQTHPVQGSPWSCNLLIDALLVLAHIQTIQAA